MAKWAYSQTVCRRALAFIVPSGCKTVELMKLNGDTRLIPV